MQFEDFDKRIKDAADHHHPAYDEQAWTKMEKLLNKHLPQKEDNRRRFLFLILLFLGLGGGALLITQPWKKGKRQEIAAASTPGNDRQTDTSDLDKNEPDPATGKESNLLVPAKDNYLVPDKVTEGNAKAPVISINGVPVQPAAKKNYTGPVTTEKILSKQNNISRVKKDKVGTNREENWTDPVQPTDNNKLVSEYGVTTTTGTVINNNAVPTKKDEVVINNSSPTVSTGPTVKNDVRADQPVATVTASENKKDETPVAKKADNKKKDTKKKTSAFFFSFSAGPDMSFVSNNKAGDVKLLTGLGLGYNYKDRLTVRTGFYTARKVYTATADAYDPPAAFFALYPYLEKVDANCKVYEIPLSLSYNFGKTASRNWFVSAGLSTFLMNEETYNYHYKYTPQGNTYTNKWTVKNKNSHFFSVATLSGGYRKDIGKKITVIAEPYFKIPLGGVGYGKVKLNSGGVLFTVGVKPF